MNSNYFVKLDTRLFLVAVMEIPDDAEAGKWARKLALDLARGDASTAEIGFARQLLLEAEDFRAGKAKAGQLGGLAKASSALAKASSALAKASSALAKASTPLARSRSNAETEAETEAEATTAKPLCGSEALCLEKFKAIIGRNPKPFEARTIRELLMQHGQDRFLSALDKSAGKSKPLEYARAVLQGNDAAPDRAPHVNPFPGKALNEYGVPHGFMGTHEGKFYSGGYPVYVPRADES